ALRRLSASTCKATSHCRRFRHASHGRVRPKARSGARPGRTRREHPGFVHDGCTHEHTSVATIWQLTTTGYRTRTFHHSLPAEGEPSAVLAYLHSGGERKLRDLGYRHVGGGRWVRPED